MSSTPANAACGFCHFSFGLVINLFLLLPKCYRFSLPILFHETVLSVNLEWISNLSDTKNKKKYVKNINFYNSIIFWRLSCFFHILMFFVNEIRWWHSRVISLYSYACKIVPAVYFQTFSVFIKTPQYDLFLTFLSYKTWKD